MTDGLPLQGSPGHLHNEDGGVPSFYADTKASATTMLTAALAYAARGLPVFALRPLGTKPVTPRGFRDATTNPASIRRMWRIAECNIGISTGAPSGFWVVDVDPGGEAEIDRLQIKHGALPPTRTMRTPRGGWHWWFKYVGPVPNSTSKIAPHVDVRGDGGYVAVAPSLTEDGAYQWLGDPAAPLAIAPDWLIALARKRPSISERALAARPPANCNGNAYGMAALDREIADLAATPAGQRNTRLNFVAFRLFQLVSGGELEGGTVEQRLVAACEANGLIADDGLRSVIATINSGRRAGMAHPRSRRGAPC
jgi:hypothetical protein